jgi:3-deoxy-D-manno-octulosonic-acid transferase
LRKLYTLLHYLMVPALLVRLVWRGFRNPGYWRRWRERFGSGVAIPSHQQVIWVHAVSVGEVQAALPIVNAMRQRTPEAVVVVTTTTPTGSSRVTQSLGADVLHCYLPYDLPGAVKRFLDRLHPSLAVIMETELWPNLLRACGERSIPVLLANVRLSEKSAAGYRKFSKPVAEMLSDVSAVAAQSDTDARRLIALGADPGRVTVTGSVKFDVNIPASLREEAASLRRRFGSGRSVWIAASTHEGEERIVLKAFREVLRRIPGVLLILVPRHPERFGTVEALVKRSGLRYALRSRSPDSCQDVDVYIGDSMGELQMFYAAADVAFVGGSLVPVGGHNMLEPGALGIPVIIGPHVFNFADISTRLVELGIARKVADDRELAEAVSVYLQDANQRHNVGEAVKKFVEENRGARDKVMEIIDALLETKLQAGATRA